MRVAAIVPNLNYGHFLGRALRSLRIQAIQPDEVIVVDGGSTDNSREVAAQFGARWIETPPRGMADARNVGIAATDCELILPLDADDWIEPTYLERTIPAMTDGIGVVATGLVWPGGRIQWPVEPITRETLLTGNRLFTCSLFRKQCWQEVGGYDTERRIYEDWLFFGAIAAHGWKFAVVREGLFHYCPHPGSSCGRMKPGDDAEYRQRTIEKLSSIESYVL